MTRRVRTVALLLLVVAVTVPASAQQAVTDRYDETFRKYTKRFFGPGYDWRLFKAQAMTESNLNQDARSHVGARGLMQLMPTAFKEVQTKNPDIASIDDPEWNIAAGISYDRRLWQQLSGHPNLERRRFMLGGYNAGLGTVRRAKDIAQQRALDPMAWQSIEAVAPEVPRWRHEETVQYVQKTESNVTRMDRNGRVVKAQP